MSLVLLLILASYPASAQDASEEINQIERQDRPVTLGQAINVAIANNTDIKRSLLALQGADQQVRIAWSEVLPDISGNATYTRNIELPVIFIPQDFSDPNSPLVPITVGTNNNWAGGITATQTLFRGEAIVGISSSELYKAAQAENLRATTQQVVTQTRLAYYNVLVAREQLRLQESTVERLRENLADNRARLRAGLIDEYDVLQVEVQLANQEPLLTQAQYAVQQAYRELKMVMGVPLELQFSVIGDLSSFDILSKEATEEANRHIKAVDRLTPYAFGQTEDLIDLASEYRGDLRLLEKQEELNQREIRAIKSRFLPTISATYNLNWQANDPGNPNFFGTDDQRVQTQSVALNFSLPLFQGFERSANLQIAQIENKDLALQIEQAVRSAKNEIRSAREALNQAIETAAAREKAVQQAREGYQRARLRLDSGIGSQLDVTEAELQLRQAEANYAQMVYDYLSAKARYDLAVGIVPFVDKTEPELD
jgi:outer membrane protein TolC